MTTSPEAAGKAAAKRVCEQYEWQEISENIEKAYFEICGRNSVEVSPKRPTARQKITADEDVTRRRAG